MPGKNLWQRLGRTLQVTTIVSAAGAVGTVAVAITGTFEAARALDVWVPATRGYVERAVAPILIIGLENKIANADGRQETLRARLDMLARGSPDDPAIRTAKEILQGAIDNLETVKAQANCDIRETRGLACAR